MKKEYDVLYTMVKYLAVKTYEEQNQKQWNGIMDESIRYWFDFYQSMTWSELSRVFSDEKRRDMDRGIVDIHYCY